MATFGGLYDFPDLLDGQLELSSPPNSSDNEYTEDKEDTWYNIPLDSDDLDDDLAKLALPLLASSTAFVITTRGPKEHSTGARIKAIYMLKDKKSLA
jgi:hypothetical protein